MFSDLPFGSYDIFELAPLPPWALSGAACTGADFSTFGGGVDVNLDPGEDAVCTFVNAQPGTLTIVKLTDPAGSAETFDFTSDLGGFSLAGDGASVTFVDLTTATYEVVEQAKAGWDLTSVDCGGATVVNIAGGVQVDVPQSIGVTCFFTNTQHAGITIGKSTNPVDISQEFDFDGDLGEFTLAHGDIMTFTGLLPGDYEVSEIVPAGWTYVGADCIGGDTAGTTDGVAITLQAGETITCYFNNEGASPATPTAPPTSQPTPTEPPTPSPTPSPTPPPVPQLTQGDLNGNGSVSSTDALLDLRYVAGFSVDQQPGCPAIGSEVASIFGDVDCDDDVDSLDALKILQHVAAIPFTQNEPCPDIGEPL